MIVKETYVFSLKETWRELIAIFKALLPKNGEELILFFSLLLIYGSFGWIIAHETCIQDCLIKKYDTYFSYDVGIRFHGLPFGFDVAHPLYNLYATPIGLFFEFFGNIYDNHKIKTIGFAAICNIMVCLSSVYIFRYLTEIIKINSKSVVYLFLLFYAFSYVCLTLSFTIETFSFCIFVLSFFVYYSSLRIQQGGKFPFLINLFFSFIIGGLTITNIVKSFIPMFFVGDKFSKVLKQVIVIGCVLGVCFLGVLYRDTMYDFFIMRFTDALPEKNVEVSFWQGWENLIGGAFLFPSMSVVSALLPKAMAPVYNDYFIYQIDAIPFSYMWEHLFIVLLSILMFIPLFTDFRNKLVQLLFLFLSVDILIHVIVKFGMHEAYIYGGHWAYLVPLLFGWGYKSLDSWKRYAYLGTIACLFICMIVCNSTRLVEFVEISKVIWPAEAYKW